MVDILLTGPAIIVLLGTLVFFHEFGHFTMAKLLKMRVDEFAFGFGPKWIRLFKRGDTEYTIHPIPLGGFVKIAGMEVGEEHVPDGFMAKPWYSRFLVYFAGPAMSFVLAYIIFCTLGMTVGLPIGKDVMAKVDLVMPESVAFHAGLRSGDVIVAINGKKLNSGNEMLKIVHSSAFKPLTITVRRDGREFEVNATPQALQVALTKTGLTVDFPIGESIPDRVSAVAPGSEAAKQGFKVGDVIRYVDGHQIGAASDLYAVTQTEANKPLQVVVYRGNERVQLSAKLSANEVDQSKVMGLLGFAPKQRLQRVSFADSVRFGNDATGTFVKTTFKVLFSRQVKDAVGGPIAIADATFNSVKRGMDGYLQLMGILSLSLAIVNIMPIPVVDGGQMALLLVEALRRRRLSQRTWEMSQRIGWTMIAILFMFIMYLDLTRLMTNKLFR